MTTGNGKHDPDFITPIQEWINDYEFGVPVVLSSGRHVRLRTVNVRTFLEYGGIPDYLTPQVEKMLLQLQTATPEETMKLDDLKKQNEIIDIFACTCIVHPTVVNKRPQDCGPNELSVFILSDDEKGEIFGMLGKSTRYIQAFFQKQEATLDAIYSLQRIQQEAKRDARLSRTNKRARSTLPEG